MNLQMGCSERKMFPEQTVSFFFFFFFLGGASSNISRSNTYNPLSAHSVCSDLHLLHLFFFLFALSSSPVFVKRHALGTAASRSPLVHLGLPAVHFCSKIIPPPPPPPHPLLQSLCDGASSGGGAASCSGWSLGLRGCQTAMSLSANAQPAQEAAQPQLALSCSH